MTNAPRFIVARRAHPSRAAVWALADAVRLAYQATGNAALLPGYAALPHWAF